ncbi:hypothetical protein CPB86DRAFT_790919 [Serendipita vermifera]|nr:hypothetical protein CPB86DRAFT_790919 [Serendipita vermifera]
MKLSIATIGTSLLLVQSASAWTFLWRGSDNLAHIYDGGDNNRGCTRISHAKGKTFEWDRGFFSDCCISLYAGTTCSGDPQGYSCSDWKKAASLNLNSYKVTHC